MLSVHMPQRLDLAEEEEDLWMKLQCLLEERFLTGEDFSGGVGEQNRGDNEVLERYGAKKRNAEGQTVVDFPKTKKKD